MPAPVGRLISSDSLPVGGFTPGMVLAGRYRIIGLIGRGGMGEVYRADDLKLGQPVALKFLPKALADDPVRRERLFAEVRIARQVSHPNICRVYDIGELDGRHFLTMEYIDGEDLASLLKRIGSLHGTKALDVTRQLCAGLVAAHDKGVLHRDLKPANVMLDGRGHVRITDFGLAVAAGEEVSAEDVSGTPPYMAPEQFAGKGASVRSDIYALGLIFYEIYTGRRAFEARTLAELRTKKESSLPTAPSEIARDIDPIVERVILRCMEKDPRQRPASAAQVAAALPGGDPLAAAIAAGETPSPEMVAASGNTEGLKPWIAWACLAFIILAIAASVMLKQRFALYERVPMENPPETLVAKAREILKIAGYPSPPTDSAFGFEPNAGYLRKVEKDDKSPSRFDRLPALAVQFWYRQSPRPILPPVSSSLTATNPLLTAAGESAVWLDPRGNLTGLRVIPAEAHRSANSGQPPDWSALFKASGIDQSKFNSVAPEFAYLGYEDTRAAWSGTLPNRPDIPIRIEATALAGKPTSWYLLSQQGNPVPNTSLTDPPGYLIFHLRQVEVPTERAFIMLFIVFPLIIFGSAYFARRNLRMGRGDRRGATRVACFILILYTIAWIFGAHHVVTLDAANSIFVPAGTGLLTAGVVWLMYVGLEPFVRRRWPRVLVGWNCLLSGSFRDPVVGRDMLVGCGLGAACAVLSYLRFLLASWFNAPQVMPSTGDLSGGLGLGAFSLFSGSHVFIADILDTSAWLILATFGMGFLLFLVRVLFRKTWAAAAFLFLLWGAMYYQQTNVLIAALLGIAVFLFAFFRFGLLTSATLMVLFGLLVLFPITAQLSAWYSGIGLTGLALLLAFALYAFHTSLGGQPMFGRAALED